MSGFTKWKIVQEEGGWYVRADAPYPEDWYICRLSNFNGWRGSAELIVNAPETLDVLKAVRDGTAHPKGPAVEAAIAKAEGRS